MAGEAPVLVESSSYIATKSNLSLLLNSVDSFMGPITRAFSIPSAVILDAKRQYVIKF